MLSRSCVSPLDSFNAHNHRIFTCRGRQIQTQCGGKKPVSAATNFCDDGADNIDDTIAFTCKQIINFNAALVG